MNKSRRFELWISGILGVVCLLLLNVLVWQLQKGPTRQLAIVDLARSGSVAEHPTNSSRTNQGPSRVERGVDSIPAKGRGLQPQAQGARHTLKSEIAKPVLLRPPEARPQAVAPFHPKTITLEPLGYVEKADGRVEAIISLGEHVQVAHEGEILEGKFRVTRLSSSSVELVESSATVAEAPLTAEVGQGVGPAPKVRADQGAFPPNPEQVSNISTGRQFSGASAADSSQASLRRELGYVERADGRVEAIVDEGDHVRLAQATKAFADGFRAPAPSPANLEVVKVSPPAINPPDSVALESQPRQTDSITQEAEGSPLIALGAEPSAQDQPEGISAGKGELGPEPLGIVQPEALADYSGSRFGANIPQTLAPALPAIEPATPSDTTGNQSAMGILGYVEKAGGEKEGIVEVLGQVYLVHEGELFAAKYRVMQVTPSSVTIVEELTKGSSEPGEPRRNSEPVRPPISRWRAPPLSTGSSGTDPPAEAGKTGELAAGDPVSTSRSPPEHSVESSEEPKGLQTLWAGRESVRRAGQPAQTDRCSPAWAFNQVGFVEKASGETQAIVADQGGVYLVPAGKVPSDIQNCQFRSESGIVAQGRDSP
jgi:hypothetical protein